MALIADATPVATRSPPQAEPCDVCIIVEGAYPYVAGGLSTWIDSLIRRQPSLTFTVVSLLPKNPPPKAKFSCPPNRTALHHLYLGELPNRRRRWTLLPMDASRLFTALHEFFENGGQQAFAEVERLLWPFIRAGR